MPTAVNSSIVLPTTKCNTSSTWALWPTPEGSRESWSPGPNDSCRKPDHDPVASPWARDGAKGR
eukprot:4172734-Heterocapsa_arctica.AAC.1